MKYAIIGAGFTGLSAAYDLAKAGHQVTLFEASSIAGGLASGFKEPHWDWYLEKYYHHWFASDFALKQLLHELNLDHKLIFSRPSTVIYHRSQFFPLDSPSAILKFPALSLKNKLKFAAVTADLKYFSSWIDLESQTAVSWMIKHYGETIYQLIWEPLLQGKFGPYHEQVNMAWMWARLKFRTSNLGTYQGGFQALINDFLCILEHLGVVIHLNSPITHINPIQAGFSLKTQENEAFFDAILVTTSPQLTASLTPFLPESYLEGCISQKYLSAVMVILSLKQALSSQNYYWYNLPKNLGFPFLALVEHTNFVLPTHFGGDSLIYCGDYVEPAHPYLTMSEAELTNTFIKGLKMVNPNFTPTWIKKTWVFKSDYAQPVPGVNHSRQIPAIITPIKNLYYASMCQVYPQDRGTNYAIEIGRRAAKLMLAA